MKRKNLFSHKVHSPTSAHGPNCLLFIYRQYMHQENSKMHDYYIYKVIRLYFRSIIISIDNKQDYI
jgi:hypothetical protein